MIFTPDPSPIGMPEEHAEWIVRQLRRIQESGVISSEEVLDNRERIITLEQHPPRTDNPHQTNWANLLNKPSCVMNWRGAYSADKAPFAACDVVLDAGWAMVANKSTEDRPAPQPQGEPYWILDQVGAPTWVLQSANVSNLIVGQRYTAQRSGYLTAVRFDRAEATPTVEHSLWVVTDPTGMPGSQKIVGPVVPDNTGWVVFPQGALFVLSGQVFDAFLMSQAISVPSSFAGTWDYKRSNGNPSSKEIWHQSAGGGLEMRINHIDDDDADRQVDLEKLVVGDQIEGGSGNWTITAVDHQLDHVRFNVDPAERITEGKYLFTFTTYAPQPIAYNRADNHYAGDARVQGFYSETGYANIMLDEHAYGVDVQVQDAFISPDWDPLAYSS